MNKQKVIFGAVFVIAVIFGFLYQSGFFLSEDAKDEQLKKEQIAKIKQSKFAKLKTISLVDAEKKMNNKEDIILYFGWVYECGDSRLFETNSVDKFLSNKKVTDKMYVVNLDKELPAGLKDQKLREPVAQKFKINTWTKDSNVNPMELKSPQLVHYKNGEISDLVSWTILNGDSKTGIKEELTQAFFDKLS